MDISLYYQEKGKAIVYETHNETKYMKGILIRR